MNRRHLAAPAALAGILLLAACSSGGDTTPVGTSQTVQLNDEDSSTDATVEFAITSAEAQPIDALADFNLSEEELAQTPTFVVYTVTLTEGELGDYDFTPFMYYEDELVLMAEDAAGDDATAINLIGGLDECRGLSDGALSSLAVGESVEACTVFLGDSPEGLGKITLGKKHTWTVGE